MEKYNYILQYPHGDEDVTETIGLVYNEKKTKFFLFGFKCLEEFRDGTLSFETIFYENKEFSKAFSTGSEGSFKDSAYKYYNLTILKLKLLKNLKYIYNLYFLEPLKDRMQMREIKEKKFNATSIKKFVEDINKKFIDIIALKKILENNNFNKSALQEIIKNTDLFPENFIESLMKC